MSSNIIIRKAKNNYVCDCCGHIIRAGSEYLDKVILNNGKCVEHTRYHDECPRLSIQELLLSKIVANQGSYIVADKDGNKINIIGVVNINLRHISWCVIYNDWNDIVDKRLPIDELCNYHDADGNPVI